MNYFSKILLGVVLATIPVWADESPTADQLWQRILMLYRPAPSAQTTKESEFQRLQALETEADAFWQRYPDHPHLWETKLVLLQARLDRAGLEGRKPDLGVVEADMREIATAQTAPESVRAEAVFSLIEVSDALEPARAERLLKEYSTNNVGRISMEARRRLAMKDLLKKPLDLKFTAVDGAPFDLEKWRGKVVLVDFWATWCGPCRMEVPRVVSTYKKLREKGFEIVGISLDASKDKLLAYAKENEMTWPQYFDGKVWENNISRNYGINGIPTVWLVDKKGFIRSTNARADLEANVLKLLAE